MFERILVPLDGSEAAEVVFPYVADIASRFGSRIFLTRVCESNSQVIAKECESYLDGAGAKLKSQIEGWQTGPVGDIETRALSGNPAIEILKLAGEIDCGLIAVTSRGASGQGPWPLGNIAAKILRASSYPVLLVRKRAENSRIAQKNLISRIMVPLDGSKLGEATIPIVEALAAKTGAAVTIFRVVEPVPVFAGPTGEVAWSYVTTYERNSRIPVESYLERMKESLRGRLPGIKAATGEGLPAGEIIDFAQGNDIDLIAMSTHGRSGIGRWVYGSVTEKVLHSGDQPVLVVRPKPGDQ